MSNWSLLFLVTALIAALFAFGSIDATVSDRAQVIFAIAVVVLATTLAVKGLQRNFSRREEQTRPNDVGMQETTNDGGNARRFGNKTNRDRATKKR